MHPEVTVEVEDPARGASAADRDRRARFVIDRIAMGDDDIHAVNRAAQEHDHEAIAVAGRSERATGPRVRADQHDTRGRQD